ncbi:Thioredoxin-dependent 5'-adenylylsulfate reductase [Burkholderiales bacterium 8X]|nr:Thioredoxin-dependent 5'-adenylylsulfate reductase [Burkholderiales bacterium 8X]
MNAISLHARPSRDFEAKVEASVALMRRAAMEFAPITQASSLGAEDMVVTDLLQRFDIESGIFVLETGKLHPETLDLLDRLQAHYGRQVDVYRPDAEAAAAFVAANGEDAMYRSLELRKGCCHIRKMEPLERALAGKRGWITGLRREQSGARAEVDAIERQPGRAKVNPLADWTWGDVWHYIASNDVPYNPLHDAFFPSIGCAPCTRAVSLGEDFRSGRWWWEQESAKECGLHVVGADADADAGAHVVSAVDHTHDAEEPPAFEPLRRAASAAVSAPVSVIPIRALER